MHVQFRIESVVTGREFAIALNGCDQGNKKGREGERERLWRFTKAKGGKGEMIYDAENRCKASSLRGGKVAFLDLS